jgi:proteasome lid subunit RPN8/RPN11
MQKLRRNLTLSERALIDIITSSIEVYKKETFGLLLGEKHKKHYMINDVLNFQTAKRGYEWVNVPTMRINRINYVLSHLTDLKVVGDFHSHPDGPARLSGLDKKDTKNSGLTLTVLVVINKIKRKIHGWMIKENDLVGTIGNKYHVKIIAYEYDKKQDKFHKIKIVCSCLKKMNKLKIQKKK